jgi:hypothetical protein
MIYRIIVIVLKYIIILHDISYNSDRMIYIFNSCNYQNEKYLMVISFQEQRVKPMGDDLLTEKGIDRYSNYQVLIYL